MSRRGRSLQRGCADGSDGKGDGNTGRRRQMIAITGRRVDLGRSLITWTMIELIRMRSGSQTAVP
jgi:hypothetical protein